LKYNIEGECPDCGWNGSWEDVKRIQVQKGPGVEFSYFCPEYDRWGIIINYIEIKDER